MAIAVWTVRDSGYDNDVPGLFNALLKQGSFPALDGDDLIMQASDYQLRLHGTFITDKGKVIGGGLITGFDIDYGPTELIHVTGYSIDYHQFVTALTGDNAEAALDSLFFFGDTIQMYGSENADTLRGGSGFDYLTGEGGNDLLLGLGGGDNLVGGSGHDTVKGGAGNDSLRGGLGKDVLVGGADQDIFVFDTALGKGNVDTVTGFKLGYDLIYLDTDIFSALKSPTSLADGEFRIGTKAADANDRIIYNDNTGGLYYDADGKGGAAQVKFAVLPDHLDLWANCFLVGDL